MQPTPRWDLHADTIVLNIDHYTLLRNAIFNVKGVPLLYLPVIYYPTKEDDRATGFLMPTYGTSSTRAARPFSNAFFWAINRSQDATLRRTTGTRRPARRWRASIATTSAAARTGNFTALDLLDQDERRPARPRRRRRAATRSAANAPTSCCRGGCGRGRRVDYFSSFTTMQTFNTNVYDASRTSRTLRRPTSSARGGSYSLNGTFDRTEYFTNADQLGRWRATRRASRSRATSGRSRAGRPLYFSVNGEFADFVRESRRTTVVYDIEPRARRLLAPDALSVQALAVVHGQLVGLLA